MKHLLLILSLIFTCFVTSANENQSVTESYEPSYDCCEVIPDAQVLHNDVSNPTFYSSYKDTPEWRHYKTFRACAWTSLGIGVTAMGVGIFVDMALSSIHGPAKGPAGVIVFCSGLGLTAVSVPLFIAARHNKKRAHEITLSMSTITSANLSCQLSNSPALGISITF